MSEMELQKEVLDWLSLQVGVLVIPCYRAGGRNGRKRLNKKNIFYNGIPDILVFSETVGLLGIELKVDKNQLSEDQEHFHQVLNILGAAGRHKAHCIVARSLNDVIYALAKK